MSEAFEAWDNDVRVRVKYHRDWVLCRIRGLDIPFDVALMESVEADTDGLQFTISIALLEKYIRQANTTD